LPAGAQSTWPSTCSTPPEPAVVEVVGSTVVAVVAVGCGFVAGLPDGPDPVGAVVTVVVVTVEAVVGLAPARAVVRGVRGGAGDRVPGVSAPLLEPAEVATPSGMALGGGTVSRRPMPVRTPRKKSSEAPRTAAAAFIASVS
jgi:hypothetical protein